MFIHPRLHLQKSVKDPQVAEGNPQKMNICILLPGFVLPSPEKKVKDQGHSAQCKFHVKGAQRTKTEIQVKVFQRKFHEK